MSENVFLQPEPPKQTIFRLAQVTGVQDGGLLIRFDDEQQARQKPCRKLGSCAAAAGDRVLCAAISGSWVALGTVV